MTLPQAPFRPSLSARRILRECAISAVVNALASLAVFTAMFGLSGYIPATGWGSFASDFLVQGFAVGLAATAIPTLLLHRGLISAKAVSLSAKLSVIRKLALRSFVISVLSAVGSVVVWWGGLRLLDISAILVSVGAVLKTGYGACLAALLTRWALTVE